MNIKNIFEVKKIENFLIKKWILNQYIKAKKFILEWKTRNVDLKIREPKILWIFYFRINRQYRAHARLENNSLIVFRIDNHQN